MLSIFPSKVEEFFHSFQASGLADTRLTYQKLTHISLQVITWVLFILTDETL